MNATNVVTSIDTVGIGYHRQEQLVHPKAIITTEDDHHTLDTLEIDVMTGEATADLIVRLHPRGRSASCSRPPAQPDTPAGTETKDEGTRQTATELKANHPQVAMRSRIDIV